MTCAFLDVILLLFQEFLLATLYICMYCMCIGSYVPEIMAYLFSSL